METIVAKATAAGGGAVGIVRVSGRSVPVIALALLKKIPPPRTAVYQSFWDEKNQVLDQGIALYFPAPHSFTGEDILELHGHGGPIVLELLIQRILSIASESVRLAQPGEFSQRAFLNGKIDLAQAESIADLIASSSEYAARSAVRSLRGNFSEAIHKLMDKITKTRMHTEAHIDFPDEDITPEGQQALQQWLQESIADCERIFQKAQYGVRLKEGRCVVLAGAPNAGKSSLLNALTQQESAIVTNQPGTTRDILREDIQIDGIPIRLIDTAGLRSSDNIIESEGVRRAADAILSADTILFVIDASNSDIDSSLLDLSKHPKKHLPLPLAFFSHFMDTTPITPDRIIVVYNKVDLLSADKKAQFLEQSEESPAIYLSVKTGEGMEDLLRCLKEGSGDAGSNEDVFIARRRHIHALTEALQHLKQAQEQLQAHQALELLAEDLRAANNALGKIVGAVHSDQLLGEIFSGFCIGK